MMYFRLAPDCFFVQGKKDAALYDVHRSRILLLDQRACEILRRCEDNTSLGSWLGESGMRFLQTLQDDDLGSFDSAPAYIDKLLLRAPVEWKGFCTPPPRYRKVDWSITNQCDLDCEFCGSGKTLSWQSCETCLRRDKNTEVQIGHINPEQLIAQIASLGVEVIHIRGGNPLLAVDALKRILRTARSYPNLSVVVTTPVTSRTLEPLLSLCREAPLQLNIVMFGIDDGVTKTVCGRENVWKDQLTIIDALVKAENSPFITFLLSHLTRQKRSEFQKFVENRWKIEPSFAEVYMRKAVLDGIRFSHVDEKTKPLRPWRSVDEFFFRVRFNTCTYGNFEICPDWKIRPCAGLERVCGDIANDGLRGALSGHELYEIWEMGKRKIQPCNQCALRFACADCTVVELAGVQEPVLKKAYCPYDPTNGKLRAHLLDWGPSKFVASLRASKE